MTRPPRHTRPYYRRWMAALAVLALLVGPPVLMVAFVGDPVPSAHTVHLAVQLRWLPHRLVLQLAACLGWIVWTYLLSAVAVETVATLRSSRPVRLLPGAAGRLVHIAVTTVVLTSGVLSRTQLTAAAAPPSSVAAVAVTHPDRSADGDETGRSTEVVYTVQPRDTLWDIAEDQLGDPLRWRGIWTVNAGRVMDDGTRFDTPSLIRTGWQLRIPHARPSNRPGHASAPPAQPRGSAQVSVPDPRPSVPAQTTQRPAAPAVAPASTRNGTVSATATQHRGAPVWPVWPVGLGFGVAAAGLVAQLDRRRRRAQRRRATGRRIPLPTGALAAAEHALRTPPPVDPGQAIAKTLRLAGRLLADVDPAPVIRTVVWSDAGVQLTVVGATPPPPAPFQPTEAGWLLPADKLTATFAATDLADPTPGLVHLGNTEQGTVYLNLEATPPLAVAGADDAVAATVADLLVQLSGAPWADLVEIRLLADAVPPSLPPLERVTVIADADAEVRRLTQLTEQTRLALTARQAASLVAARLGGDAPPDGLSVVVAPAGHPQVPALLELAADPCGPVTVVLLGAYPSAVPATVTADEVSITDPPLAVRRRVADLRLVDALRELLTQPAGPDLPATASPYDTVTAETPPQPEPGPVEVRLLGPFEVVGAAEPIAALSAQIVAYLATHRRGVSRDQLAAAIWPGAAPTAKTVWNRVHEVRRRLGGHIHDARDGKQMVWRLTDDVSTDWQRFRALAAGDLADRQAALALVRGRPLDGITADWPAVEGLESEMQAAILDLAVAVADDLIAADAADAAATAARTGLLTGPADERIYLRLMQIAAMKGSVREVDQLHSEFATALDLDDNDEISREFARTYRYLRRQARQQAIA